VTTPETRCPDERLNLVVSVGLIISLLACIALYGMHKTPDGGVMQLASMIAGGLTGFLARGVRQQGAQVQAGPAGSVTIEAEQPADTTETAPAETTGV